jgi:hypothetical protein
MDMRALVEDLDEAGAVTIWAEPHRAMRDLKPGGLLVARAVVVELPVDDPDALDRLVGAYAVWSGRMIQTVSVEELESHDLGPGYWRMRTDQEPPP